MSDKFPDLIDPVLLAERRSVLSGAIKIAALGRLADLVADSDGYIEIEANFGKEGKRSIVVGSIKAALAIVCQCCLQPIDKPIDIAFKLGVVTSLEEVDRLEIDCEPLLFSGEKLSLNALIEDELILALPDYPKHDYDCIKQYRSEQNNDQDNQSKAENPFSVLAKLKNTGE